jgi:formylglycine-generating enzyme required for sulfatase activity
LFSELPGAQRTGGAFLGFFQNSVSFAETSLKIMPASLPPVQIFIAYSRLDQEFLQELRSHLTPLERAGRIKVWYDGNIEAGRNWEAAIKEALYGSDIILLLVSANSIASDYFYGNEVRISLERHERGEARVVPLILTPCMWSETPLATLQALPKDGVPVEEWTSRDKAWHNAVESLNRLAHTIGREKQPAVDVPPAAAEHTAPVRPVGGPLLPPLPRSPRAPRRWLVAAAALAALLLLIWTYSLFRPAAPEEFYDPFVGQLISVQGGEFTMGCTEERDSFCQPNEQPAHTVTVGSFQLSRYEVTQEQWSAIMEVNPSSHADCPTCPVEGVSWNEVLAFINTLNEWTGQHYRLPTEAEWEYAARGGSYRQGYPYAGGADLAEFGWYQDNAEGKTHPVGEKRPNALGLYDMTGNVNEWCADWYQEDHYNTPEAQNGQGPAAGAERVGRGGSWQFDPSGCRVAVRYFGSPTDTYPDLGFRLAQ